MPKKELLIPLAGLALVLLFAIVSVLVIITRGKNPYLVRKKLAIGAMMLSLSASAAGCTPPWVSCYEPADDERNVISLVGLEDEGAFVFNQAEDQVVSLVIRYRAGDSFSFLLEDSEGNEVQRGDLQATDGVFDESTEELALAPSEDILPGDYSLYVYACSSDYIDTDAAYGYLRVFALAIVSS